jgi:spore coat protein U-like protein
MSATINSSSYYLNYELYTDNSDTTVWNSSNQVAYTGTGASSQATFYGVVPKGQSTVPAGAYSDTVNITVTF